MGSFGAAIVALKNGQSMRRKGWNGKGIFIKLQVPDAHSFMTAPYIYIDTAKLESDNPDAPKSRVPWAPTTNDVLAEDWQMV